MEVKRFPSIIVKTKSYLRTKEEEEEHKKQEVEALEAIRSQVLSKSEDIIGVLEVKRYIEEENETTDWIVFIITSDADERNGPLQQKINKILHESRWGQRTHITDMHIMETSSLGLEYVLKKVA